MRGADATDVLAKSVHLDWPEACNLAQCCRGPRTFTHQIMQQRITENKKRRLLQGLGLLRSPLAQRFFQCVLSCGPSSLFRFDLSAAVEGTGGHSLAVGPLLSVRLCIPRVPGDDQV